MNEHTINFKLFVADGLCRVDGSAQKVCATEDLIKLAKSARISKLSGMGERLEKKWRRRTAQVGKTRTTKAAANR